MHNGIRCNVRQSPDNGPVSSVGPPGGEDGTVLTDERRSTSATPIEIISISGMLNALVNH